VSSKKVMPSWVVILAIVVTGGATAWAMLQSGRDLGLGGDPATGFSPGDLSKLISVGNNNLDPNTDPAALAVRALPPTVAVGAQRIHNDRGVCTSCHTVVDTQGMVMPAISALSLQRHDFRGLCTNCHRIYLSTSAAAGSFPGWRQAAGTAGVGAAPFEQPLAGPGLGSGTPQPVAMATEGEWLGLEVAPLTKLTSIQYDIPEGISGLVASDAEGSAAAAGMIPGYVVVSVNGVDTSTMNGFFLATKNGTLRQGTVEFLRRGQRLGVSLVQTPPTAPLTPQAGPAGIAPSGVPAGPAASPFSPAGPAGAQCPPAWPGMGGTHQAGGAPASQGQL